MNSKKFFIGLAVVLVVLAGVGFYFVSQAPQTGGSASADHYNIEQFFGGLRSHVVIGLGGIQKLNAAAATTTITASQICSGDVIQWAPTTNNATATFDTTANIVATCLNSAGNKVSVQIQNTAATNTFYIAAAANETVYHVDETATTTAQGLSMTSSTPVIYDFTVTLVTNTSTVSSTINIYQHKFLTP